jgi:hypothetical protein
MAAGDVTVFGPTTPDKLKALMEAASVASTWGCAMCSYGSGMVVAITIEAA